MEEIPIDIARNRCRWTSGVLKHASFKKGYVTPLDVTSKIWLNIEPLRSSRLTPEVLSDSKNSLELYFKHFNHKQEILQNKN